MTDATAGDALALGVHELAHGRQRLTLVDQQAAGAPVLACELTIDPLELHDGRGATIRVGGIGNVATAPSHRRRGLASQLLQHAIELMRDQQLDASLLYGIDGFYHRLGWRTCGDERWLRIPLQGEQPSQMTGRIARTEDVATIADIYAAAARLTPGAAARPRSGRVWAQLDPADVLVVERDGALAGYAWRGAGRIAERDARARDNRAALVIAELHALDQDSTLDLVDAVRAHAEAWADGASRSAVLTELLVGAPEPHPLRQLARAHRLSCQLIDEVRPSGGAMLLPFTDRGDLPGELYQYLPDRF